MNEEELQEIIRKQHLKQQEALNRPAPHWTGTKKEFGAFVAQHEANLKVPTIVCPHCNGTGQIDPNRYPAAYADEETT